MNPLSILSEARLMQKIYAKGQGFLKILSKKKNVEKQPND